MNQHVVSAGDKAAQLTELQQAYRNYQQAGLKLNLTRGKPGSEQLALSNAMGTIPLAEYHSEDGTDIRNYGGLRGIAEARKLFGNMINVPAENIMMGDNASLTLMYQAVETGLLHGFTGSSSAWSKQNDIVKFLAPVPGYDRHFSVCERLGIELIPVAMNDSGPDMDQVESLLQQDSSIKGIWCVPRFSNPTGTVYSGEVVKRFAQLGKFASEGFRIFWDNAYAVHTLEDNAPELANIFDACQAAGTLDSVLIFGSTSKITFAGGGVAFIAASENNLKAIEKTRSFITIGPDKINQMRHVKFLQDNAGIKAHMQKHAELLKPRFQTVIEGLKEGLAGTGMAEWTTPQGGYFISLNTQPGLAKKVVKLAADAGVALTPAGATFPYGNDPEDRNIRIAPSVPSLEEIKKATEVLVCCIKLASLENN